MAAMGAEDSGEAYEAFQAYAWSLPVTYTEELTVKPKEQTELDTLAGKTVGELLAEGYADVTSSCYILPVLTAYLILEEP